MVDPETRGSRPSSTRESVFKNNGRVLFSVAIGCWHNVSRQTSDDDDDLIHSSVIAQRLSILLAYILAPTLTLFPNSDPNLNLNP